MRAIIEGDIVSSDLGIFVVDTSVSGINLVLSTMWTEDGSHKRLAWFPPISSLGPTYHVVGNVRKVGSAGLIELRRDWAGMSSHL